MLVVADLTGRAQRARILAAAEISLEQIQQHMPDLIEQQDETGFDSASREVRARRTTRIGAIVLEEAPLTKPKGEAAALALAKGVAQLGPGCLPFSKASRQFRQRLAFLHRTLGEPWPDVGDAALLASLQDWFVPFQSGVGSLSDISPDSLQAGLASLVPHGLSRDLAALVPTHFTAPTGQSHPIHYEGDEPVLQIRVQELFGLKVHPTIGGGKLPLLLELTSPAHRPIQTTRDLPGFWSGSWKDVRAEMRGRYPKHPWPEDPASATPTHRAKPRGT